MDCRVTLRGLFGEELTADRDKPAIRDSQATFPQVSVKQEGRDASTDSEKAEWWYCTIGFFSSATGPLPPLEIRNLAKAGKITPSSQVRHDSQDRWDIGKTFPWIFDASLPLPEPGPVTVPTQSVAESKNRVGEMRCPKRQGNLVGLADFAALIGGIGVFLAIVVGFVTFAVVLPSKSGEAFAGGLITLVVTMLISSLLWFIIAGALRAFEHLIRVSEFTAERMLNIEQSLQRLAATQGGDKQDGQ